MYSQSTRQLKKIAWLNIVAQISCSFLGLYNVAVAETVQLNPLQNHTQLPFGIKAYTIEFGEGIDSILKKYNMSLDLFYRLNPSYNPAQGTPKLRVGDRINLPLKPLPQEIDTAKKIENKERKLEENITKTVMTAGGILSADNVNSKDVSDKFQNMATNILSNHASSALEQWLGQYGHARVQLGVDKDFSLKSSKYDFLAPIVDRENSLFFLQNSIHRTDDRTQTNVGLGLRYFAEDYMIGGNTFWDYDISRGHSRASIGLEYWRDYLKLAANNYFRLSEWKDSKDLQDYDERAANGWDLRVETYLPFYPQLGAKLSYEQYYGDQVAMFGQNDLKKDPYAATVGISYTPIPLLTLGAEHIRGQSNDNDTKLSAQLNYRLGVPWAQQIDPNAVNALRSLAGSRYDFVDRNNNIVLEYRKKELIKIALLQTIEGQAGEKIWVSADIVSKYNIQDVDWNDVGITNNGGHLNPGQLGMVEITLPAYIENGINSYSLSAQATDINQNQSNVATTTVLVKAIPLSQSQLELSTDKVDALANGQDKITATAVLLDKNNKPIANQKIQFKVPAGVVLSPAEAETDANGKVTVALSSSAVITGQLTAVLKNEPNKIASANFNFKADTSTADISTLTASKNDAIANGTASNEVTATVKNASGELLADQEVTFSADNGAKIITEKVKTDANGVAVSTLTNTTAGTTTVTATINAKSKTVQTNFKADTSTADISTLVATKNDAIANGTASNEVTATVKDAVGNLLVDQEVIFSADNGAKIITEKVKTDAKGVAVSTLTNTTAGTTTVTATINAKSKTVQTNFKADTSTADISTLTASKNDAIANGTASNEVTAIVKDAAGNLLVDQEVIFSADDGAKIITEKVKTDAKGVAVSTLTNTTAGTTTVTATTNGRSKTVQTNFKADTSTADISTLTASKNDAIANGTASNEVTATVKDAAGNLLVDQEVTFSADNGAKIITEKVKTDAKGIAVSTLTNTTAGTATVTATINGNSKTVATNFKADVAPVLTIKTDKTDAKVGDSISLSLRYYHQDTNTGVADTPVTVQISSVVNRQNVLRSDSGALLFNGKTATEFDGKTDSNGELKIAITDPDGIGVQTTIKLIVNGNEESIPLIYRVISSPDTDKANMWGYMTETVSVNGDIVSRPQLSAESSLWATTNRDKNEVWGVYEYKPATNYCSLPTKETLVALQKENGDVRASLGWPGLKLYRTSTSIESGVHTNISLVDGRINDLGGDEISQLYIVCSKN